MEEKRALAALQAAGGVVPAAVTGGELVVVSNADAGKGDLSRQESRMSAAGSEDDLAVDVLDLRPVTGTSKTFAGSTLGQSTRIPGQAPK
jgi:hypothetical protein